MSERAEKKIVTREELVHIRRRLADDSRVVVQCHGCFDIVHPGHIRYLKFARDQGDCLIVSVSSDKAVGKGVDRPYIGERLRMENLAAIEFVDYVCLDEEDWAGPVLEALRPDVYVKGKEYEKSSDPRFAREKALVETYGGRVIFSSGDIVYSSSYIIEQFRRRLQLDGEKVRAFCERRGVTRRSLLDRLDAMADLKILVVGDPVLDRYVHCDQAGVASEGPILNVSPIRDEWYLGAAGLMAGQCRALGAEVLYLTVHGGGQGAERFADRTQELKVESLALEERERPVFVKTRYLVDGTKVFKINAGRYSPLSTVAARHMMEALEERGGEFDAWIISDFGYGLFGRELIEAVADLSRRLDRDYYLDVSMEGAANLLSFHGPRICTPTEEELRFAYADRESGLSHLAARYFRDTGAGNIVITLGKRGVLLFEPPEQGASRLTGDYLPAFGQHSVDPVGAGDVFTSILTLSTQAGASIGEGMLLASAAAALHVGSLGNSPLHVDELREWIEKQPELP